MSNKRITEITSEILLPTDITSGDYIETDSGTAGSRKAKLTLLAGIIGALKLSDLGSSIAPLVAGKVPSTYIPDVTSVPLAGVTGLSAALSAKQNFNTTLSALAGISPSVNDVPYFTNSTTSATFGTTAFSRGILSSSSASDFRTATGTNSASNLTTGTLPGERLPAFTGSVVSAGGTSSLTLSTVFTNRTVYGVTYNAEGRATSVTESPDLQAINILGASVIGLIKRNASGVWTSSSLLSGAGITVSPSSDNFSIAANPSTISTLGSVRLAQQAETDAGTDVSGGLPLVVRPSTQTFLKAPGATSAWYGGDKTGNTRGNFSLDIQTTRSGGVSKVASGLYAIAIGSNTSAAGQTSIGIGSSAEASGLSSIAIGFTATASADNTLAIGQYVKTTSPNTIELGGWSNSTTRGGAIRINASTGMVGLTIQNSPGRYVDGGSTAGAEGTNALMRSAYSFRLDGNNVFMDINIGGIVKTISMGTAT